MIGLDQLRAIRIKVSSILYAGGTFALALSAGFVMQNRDALAARLGGESEVAAPVAADGQPAMPQDRGPIQMGMMTPEPPLMRIAVLEPSEVTVAPDPVTPSFSQECTPSLAAQAGPAASVVLRLSAPCAANERATLEHGPLRVTILTSADGSAEMTLPALVADATYRVVFADGSAALASLQVPGAGDYDRAVLQWRGAGGFSLHALEFGAEYGSTGHVWNGAPRDAEAAQLARGGYALKLGNPSAPEPMLAEVYSFPSLMSVEGGTVDLSIEAEISEATCDRAIAATAVQFTRGQETGLTEISLDMPSCDAVGDFLVLKNGFEPLKIVRN